MRNELSTLALCVALVCFAIAFLLSADVVHGTNVGVWKDAGFFFIVVGLLCGRRA